MLTVNCPHCGAMQHTHATFGQQAQCSNCQGIMHIKRSATGILGSIGLGLFNISFFLISASIFTATMLWLFLVAGCFFSR